MRPKKLILIALAMCFGCIAWNLLQVDENECGIRIPQTSPVNTDLSVPPCPDSEYLAATSTFVSFTSAADTIKSRGNLENNANAKHTLSGLKKAPGSYYRARISN